MEIYMKIAIVGSRKVKLTETDISEYVSEGDEIVSGGAVGVDSYAAKYALDYGHKLTEFLPRYELYGRSAPIVRNKEIVDYADRVVVFWDGSSRGSLSVIKYAEKTGKPCKVIIRKPE